MNLPSPDVILAISSSCPHCPSMIAVLSMLVKKGDISSLQIINITVQTDFAIDNNIRSVPWLKIGPFILQGLHNQKEIEIWLARSQSEQGMLEYLTEMLSTGKLDTVTHAIKQTPQFIRLFTPLIRQQETNINVRLGMGAILESLAGQTILESLLDDLIELLNHADARVRSDAAHFLSFIKSSTAIEALKKCLNDSDTDVKEIARESLEVLSANRHNRPQCRDDG